MANFAWASLSLLLAISFFAEGINATGVLHVARQGTPTSPSSAPSIIPTPILTFVEENNIQAITCKSVKLAWFYTGPSGLIDLFATNDGVSQSDPAPSLSSSRTNTFTNGKRAIPTGAANPIPSVRLQIGSSINPVFQNYTWSAVNVPQGWYIINASMPAQSYSAVSVPFFVHSGPDTSCIAPITTSSTGGGTSPTTTGAPVPSNIPVAGASHTNLAAIIGVSIGAVVLVAIILLAWLWLYRRGKKTKNSGGNYPSASHRWNGLSSTDSRTAFAGIGIGSKQSKGPQNRSASIGTVLNGGSEEAVGAEKNSLHSKSDTSPFGDHGVALPVLQNQSPRSRSTAPSRTFSTSSSTLNTTGATEFTTPSRKHSALPESTRHSTDSATYPPNSTSSHAGRNSTQFGAYDRTSGNDNHASNLSQSTNTHSHSSHQPLIAPSPVSPQPRYRDSNISVAMDASKQSNRQSLGKRRKPVPSYDASTELSSHMPTVPPSTSPSPIPPSPGPEGPFAPSSVGSTGPLSSGSPAHYATRNQAGKDGSRPELMHKSSFGPAGLDNKQLHYLIPDMPPTSTD